MNRRLLLLNDTGNALKVANFVNIFTEPYICNILDYELYYVAISLAYDFRINITIVYFILIMLLTLQFKNSKELFEFTDYIKDEKVHNFNAIKDLFSLGKHSKNWSRLTLLMMDIASGLLHESPNYMDWFTQEELKNYNAHKYTKIYPLYRLKKIYCHIWT